MYYYLRQTPYEHALHPMPCKFRSTIYIEVIGYFLKK